MVVFQRCPTVHGPQESAAKSRSAAPADKPPRLLPHRHDSYLYPQFPGVARPLRGEEEEEEGRDLTPPPAGGDTRSCQTAADVLERLLRAPDAPPLMEAN